jgi:hypothetical protein
MGVVSAFRFLKVVFKAFKLCSFPSSHTLYAAAFVKPSCPAQGKVMPIPYSSTAHK